MNGPTRSKAFEKRVPVGRLAGGADAWPDEMDQFVDSEPLAWTSAPRSERAVFSAADEAGDEAPAASAAPKAKRGAGVHVGGPLTAAAGMRLWAEDDDAPAPATDDGAPDTSPRRDAFSRRLSDELSRPQPAPPATEPQGTPDAVPAAHAPQVSVQPAEETAAPEAASDAAPAGEQGVAGTAEPARPWRAAIAKATDEGKAGERTRNTVLSRRATPSLAKPKPAAATAPAPGGADKPAAPPPPPAPPPETAEARLERELDDAIGAIITGRPAGNGEADAPAAPSIAPETLAEPDVAPPPAAQADARPASSPSSSPSPSPPPSSQTAPAAPPESAPAADATEAPAAQARPARVVGGRRPKGVPTFTFNRRPEPEPEPFPRAPTDVDEPLAGIYLPGERMRAEGHGPITSELDADAEHYEAAAPLPDDEYDAVDPFAYDDEDELAEADVLPASLSRRGRAKSRPNARSAGIAAAVVGAGAITLLAVIGFNMFAGAGTPATEPRVIPADASDVKVRPESSGISAEPDIGERARVGETGTLVVPEDVPLSGVRRAAATSEEGIVSRPVRTVVVRPDGTLLPSDAGVRAPRSVASRQTQEPAVRPSPPSRVETDTATATATAGAVRAVAALDDPVQDPAEAAQPAQPEGGGAASGPIGGRIEVVVPRPRPTPPVRTASTSGTAASSAPQNAAPQVSAPQSTLPQSTARAPWSVQVSSQRTRADAQSSFRGLQERYGSILGNATPMIVAADVPGRGRFYRVRVAASSQREAASLCQRLKSAGADCFIGRN